MSNDKVIELSIEETNKIRLSLGLKPLRIDPPKVQTQPVNTDKNQGSDILDTLAQLKKNREKNEKPKGKTIAEQLLEEGDDDEDLSTWIQKSRNQQKQQEQQKKKSRATTSTTGSTNTKNLDPKSLKVLNNIKEFQDGREHILILEDSNVLDEDHEDTLVDMKILQKEKREQMLKDSKKPSKYDKFDEYGAPGEILSQYDEKKSTHGFVIGNINQRDGEQEIIENDQLDSVEKQQELIKKRLERYSSYELDQKSIVQSAFYTKEEMEKLKKPVNGNSKNKKGGNGSEVSGTKKKIRKKKEDSILSISGLDETTINDRGSRTNRGDTLKNDEIDRELQRKQRDQNYQKALDKATQESKITYSSDIFEESEDIEFYKALKSSKKANLNHGNSIVDQVNNQKQLKENKMKEDDDQYENDQNLKTNSVSEFVKTIKNEGLISNFKSISNSIKIENNDKEMSDSQIQHEKQDSEMTSKDENEEEDEESEEEDGEYDENEHLEKILKQQNNASNGSVKSNSRPKKSSILEDEPLVSSSMSATLRLLMSTGELKGSNQPNTNSSKKRKGIDYEDEDTVIQMDNKFGKKMTKHDLFVRQSQIFHGKKSGKNTIDKKMKQHQKEIKQHQMMSSDGQQHDIAQAFQNYQKSTNLPYLVLSGGLKDNPLLQNDNNQHKK
ncbi:SART-1 family protein [Tieghemostelium lacteum]|uniref:SART-1 family protein n=1 Tax=Tieghemostelium lacteum TaxID=361077 RepID=A0A151ZDW6_TIELA|nr:SART-1 family protein [Tieghemostelium lacteum]|eukprot:KYQ92100.1 SART-1 family protein [Tieghemostelium lacteum]